MFAKTINVRVQISVQVGKFRGGNVKYSDPNKHTCCKITAIPIKMKMQLKYVPKELDVM